MKRSSIVSFGEVLWDLFPDGEKFGGAPANFACHAATLGADVAMVSAVGDDPHGREAIRILRRFGIDVDSLQVSPETPTGAVGVKLDCVGKPTFTIYEGSAWDRIQWTGDIESRVTSADAVYFGTLGQRSEISRSTIRRCLETARRDGVMRIVDINLRQPFYDKAMLCDSIQLATILKLSDDELPEVCKACGIDAKQPSISLLRRLRESQHLDLVVMTRGAEGAVLTTSDEVIEQPGIPTIVQDTVGAGDEFTAAFILGLLRGDSHKEILLNACSIAAAVCSHSGAVPIN